MPKMVFSFYEMDPWNINARWKLNALVYNGYIMLQEKEQTPETNDRKERRV